MSKVAESDPVVLLVVQGWKRRQYYIKPRKGGVYATFAGVLRWDEIVGKPWGYTGKLGKATYYILPPTRHQLLEEFGRRRSQVIYLKDSAIIALRAGIGPGSKVFEAGVGSGFLTVVLATIVCPEGRIYGIEERYDMLEAARHNIELAGVSQCVSLRLGDVKQGVGVSGLDAGFLDLPDPWDALPAAYEALKPGAPLVVFIPTMNQLDKLVTRVEEGGLFVIEEAFEILKREIEMVPGAVRPSPRMIGHTGYIVVLRRLAREETPDTGESS